MKRSGPRSRSGPETGAVRPGCLAAGGSGPTELTTDELTSRHFDYRGSPANSLTASPCPHGWVPKRGRTPGARSPQQRRSAGVFSLHDPIGC
eukprot:6886792-Prymnesium_polylepis.1